MVKYYRLKSPVWTYWAGDIFVLKGNGNLYYLGNENPEQNNIEKEKHWKVHCSVNAKTIKAFNILENWFDEVEIDDIAKYSWLFPYDGMEYWYPIRIGGKIQAVHSVWHDGYRAGGTMFLSARRADLVVKFMELLDAGFKMDTFENQKDIGRLIITGKYNLEKSEDIEGIMMEGVTTGAQG